MADNTFVVHSEWLDAIKGFSTTIQDQIIADLVRYGCRMETVYDDIPQIAACVNLLKSRIDFSIEKWNVKTNNKGSQKEEIGERDELIWRLARTPMTSQAIADELGCSKSTIDHSEGWKQRKNDNYCNGLQ